MSTKRLAWLTIGLLAVSCKHTELVAPPVQVRGVLSMNANLSAGDSVNLYTSEYGAIFHTGVRGAQTAAPWGSLNPSGTTFDFTAISNPYFGLTALANQGFTTIFLNVPIITVSTRSLPADISALAFDDPLVKTRIHALLDTLVPRLNDPVKYVALGNEVDTYLSAHPGEWNSFKNLVEDAALYIHNLKPSLQVGVTTTFDGATNTSETEVAKLNSLMDVIVLTYYPVDRNTFVPRDPNTVVSDLGSMVTLSQGKPLVLQEWGYPSSSLLGSSEQKQAAFYSNTFAALNNHAASTIPFMSFFKYRDWAPGYVQTLTGQNAGQPFYEFMSSLGVNKNNGSSKAAMGVIEAALK